MLQRNKPQALTKAREQPDTLSDEVLIAVPLNGGCSPFVVIDVIQLEQCPCTRCSFLPEVQWRCGEIQLPSGVQWRRGQPWCPPHLCFILVRNIEPLPLAGATSNGMK